MTWAIGWKADERAIVYGEFGPLPLETGMLSRSR